MRPPSHGLRSRAIATDKTNSAKSTGSQRAMERAMLGISLRNQFRNTEIRKR